MASERIILANDDPAGMGLEAPNGLPWYLVTFRHAYLDFRLPEVEALASMFWPTSPAPLGLTWRAPPIAQPEMMPFWYVALPNDAVASAILGRTLLTRSFIEVWAEGDSMEALLAALAAVPAHRKAPWLAPSRSVCVEATAFGHKLGATRRVELLKQLVPALAPKGRVDLDTPDTRFTLCVADGTSALTETYQIPRRFYFGRAIGVAETGVSNAARFALPDRPYIGPTSMDAELAFLMANQAHVTAGQLVVDPYMGTGSLALAAAQLGAHVMGADIDARVVKMGKPSPDGGVLDVSTNFHHYGLAGRLADLLMMDMANQAFRADLCSQGLFHAVIGDPPYGVRAGAKKVVPKPEVLILDRRTHIVSTGPYGLGECLRDLLEFSARYLVLGGRLVYMLPSSDETYAEDEVPRHPCLRLLANSEQLLAKYSRRLITMDKVAPYDPAVAAAFYAANPDPTLRIEALHGMLYGSSCNDSSSRNDGVRETPSLGKSDARDTTRRFRGKRM